MFIISQLNFSEYLHEPAYATAVAQLPEIPADIKTGKKLRGDFDILVIHRQHGILIGELKTVGKDPVSRTDAIVSKTIQKAIRQLDKSKAIMSHLVNDVTSPGLTVRTTLFLPYVSREQLKRIISANTQLEQDICSTLGAADASEAAELCCCSDQLSDPNKWWEVTPAVLTQLEAWWQCRMNSVGPQLSDEIYLDIVARFVGPATSVSVHCSTGPRVQVKTVGQAVSELGQRLTTLVLTPEQVDLMHRSSWLPLVFLTGPPGTGKTLMLTLVGLSWLRQGEDVHVIIGKGSSRAVSRLIKKQLETTLAADTTSPPGCGRVFLLDYNSYKEEDEAIEALAALGTPLCILIDEIEDTIGIPFKLHRLVAKLSAQVSNLRLWAAGLRHTSKPPQLHSVKLTTPLRSAPAVLRELDPWIGQGLSTIHPYNSTGFPVPGDGPCVERLVHEGPGHTGQWPGDCFECGQNVATVLRCLDVGIPGSQVSCQDVFILSVGGSFHKKDDTGTVPTVAAGLICGVRGAGFAVRMLEESWGDRERWEKDVDDVGISPPCEIVSAGYDSVLGLERKVVVVVCNNQRSSHQYLAMTKPHAVSRATTQLVLVASPSPTTPVTVSTSPLGQHPSL